MRFIRSAALAAIAASVLPAAAAAQTGPAWTGTKIPADVLALTCAPSTAYEMSAVPLHVSGGQSLEARGTVAPGDLLTVNAGRANGMQVGQEFFVRRVLKDRGQTVSKDTPGTVQTAGWIRIYAIDEEMSLATVIYACDAMMVGDYLEPFALPVAAPRGEKKGKPEKDNYARVMPGKDRKATYAAGDFIVIDRGKDHDIVPGSQFVIYHDKKKEGNFLFEVGEAVAVDVRENSATLSVTSSRSIISLNDYVSMRK
jgi:hypothetical protein